MAQQEKKPITNVDIIKMVKARLPESTIILAIHQNPGKFDTSPDALINLKNQGVTQGILDAMLTKTNSQSPVPPRGSDRSPQLREGTKSSGPKLPTAKGVYYEGPTGLVRMEQTSVMESRNAGAFSSYMTMGVKTSKVINVYRGEQASAQLSNRRPTFYISDIETSIQDVLILRLKKQKGKREIEYARVGLIKKGSVGYRESDICQTMVNRVSDSVLVVTPSTELEQGEYILVFGEAGSKGAGYDFGITAGK